MQFSIGESQMLTAPPYGGAAIVMLSCAWFGDRYRVRGPLLLLNAVLSIVGLVLLVSPFLFFHLFTSGSVKHTPGAKILASR